MQGTRCVKVVLQPVGDERLVNVCVVPEYRGVKLHECVVCVCARVSKHLHARVLSPHSHNSRMKDPPH